MLAEVLTVSDFSETVVFLIAAALAAGLARGFSGFGAALIFVPLASAVVGPQVAVPLLLVVDGVMERGMEFRFRRKLVVSVETVDLAGGRSIP